MLVGRKRTLVSTLEISGSIGALHLAPSQLWKLTVVNVEIVRLSASPGRTAKSVQEQKKNRTGG